MKTSITKIFTFESAHSLPEHDGKCKNLHGHSYILEVTVGGEIIKEGPKQGMIMDFADISGVVKREILDVWDHQFLNDILPFTTTAESLAEECFKKLTTAGLPIEKIRLYETAKSFVEVVK